MALQIWVLGRRPCRPASLHVPVAVETDGPDPTWAGPLQWAGRGSSLSSLDSVWAVWTPPGPPSGAFASPLALIRSGDRPRLWLGGRLEGPHASRPLGSFCPRCFPRAHSGGGDPPTGVVRVGWEARVWSPWGLVARDVSSTHAFSLSKS